MAVLAALLLILFAASVRGLRSASAAPRWLYLAAATLSGGSVLVAVTAAAIAVAVGRSTWNSWVSGSPTSETVTLWLVLVAAPVLVATCAGLLITAAVLSTRQRHRTNHPSSPPP